MANSRRDLGPTGKNLSGTLLRFREQANLTPTQLSQRLRDQGRDISPFAVTRMERGDRAVDVDDLMALAVIYRVSPTTLLDPEPDTEVEVTGWPGLFLAEQVSDWIRGIHPMDDEDVAQFWHRVNPAGAVRPADPNLVEIFAKAVAGLPSAQQLAKDVLRGTRKP